MMSHASETGGKGMAGQGGDVPPPGDTEVEDLGRQGAPAKPAHPADDEEE